MTEAVNRPKHIGIIMDGNRRWAKERGMNANYGHDEGRRRLAEIVKLLRKKSIKHLTVYAFSTENWQREKSEINHLMKILRIYLKKEISTFQKEGIRFKAIGQITDMGMALQLSLIHI